MTRKALEQDPLAPLINMNGGWNYFAAGMLEEASAQAAKMMENDASFYGAYWLQGAIHLSSGEFRSRRTTERGRCARRVIMLSLTWHRLAALPGKTTRLPKFFGLLEARRQSYVPAIVWRVYSRVGDTDKAVEWIETAFAERNGEMVFLVSEIVGAADDDPLNRLAHEPRVIALLEKMKLP